MEVTYGKLLSYRDPAFQPSHGPDAALAIAVRDEVHKLTVRRPLRRGVPRLTLCERNPIAGRHRSLSPQRGRVDAGTRRLCSRYKCDPALIRREARLGECGAGLIQQ